MKRIGLLGCGVVADYGHAPAIHATPGLELSAICDPNPEALARLAAKYPWVRVTSDIGAFLRSGIDAVTIASPAPVHASNLMAAAECGLPVLCEKPLSTSDESARMMIERMRSEGLLFGVAFCYRFSPVARAIRSMVRSGRIGEVRAMRLVYLWNLHGKWEPTAGGGRRESPRRIGRFDEGGPLVDCGVHQIDLARWWTGAEVERVRAAGAWIEDHAAPGHVWLHMDHVSGCHTVVEVSFSYCQTAAEPRDTFLYELIGTDGLIRYRREGWSFEVRDASGTQWLPGSAEKDFHGMYAAWRDSLESGCLGETPDPEDGRIATSIATRATNEILMDRPGK